MSDIGTLQYSNDSDPIVWSDVRFFTKEAHKVISRYSKFLILMLSSNNIIIEEITTSSLTEGLNNLVRTQIRLASTPLISGHLQPPRRSLDLQ